MAGDLWPSSRALWARSRRVLAGGVSTGLRAGMRPHPLFFERAEGARMWDVDGHELLDYVLGWGPTILGHCHPGVTAAVQEQATKGETFGAQHRLEYLVAEKILSHFPFADRLVFTNTGSEAVQIAIRLARAWTGRSKVLKFEGHYHGWSDTLLVSYRSEPDRLEPQLESRGQSRRALDEIVVARWNDPDSVGQALVGCRSDIAAIVCEPVLCNSGVIAPQAGFLEFLRRLSREMGCALIFDEVITGYRLGLGGATGRFAVAPDLVVLGKAVANGYPLSVVAGAGDIVDLAAGGGVVHAGTFNGNPIVLSAALATLTALEQASVYETLDARSSELAAGLRRVLAARRATALVHQIGAVVQILPGVLKATDYGGYASADWRLYDALIVALLERGVFVMPGGRLYVSLAHAHQDVCTTIDAFDAALANLDL